VASGDGADLMLQFQIDRGGDGTKRYRKMKRRQRARLDCIRRKCDTTRQGDNVGCRIGDTGDGKGRRRHHLG
jgi:hypothetical protein